MEFLVLDYLLVIPDLLIMIVNTEPFLFITQYSKNIKCIVSFNLHQLRQSPHFRIWKLRQRDVTSMEQGLLNPCSVTLE